MLSWVYLDSWSLELCLAWFLFPGCLLSSSLHAQMFTLHGVFIIYLCVVAARSVLCVESYEWHSASKRSLEASTMMSCANTITSTCLITRSNYFKTEIKACKRFFHSLWWLSGVKSEDICAVLASCLIYARPLRSDRWLVGTCFINSWRPFLVLVWVRSFIEPDFFENNVPFDNIPLQFIWSICSGNWVRIRDRLRVALF